MAIAYHRRLLIILADKKFFPITGFGMRASKTSGKNGMSKQLPYKVTHVDASSRWMLVGPFILCNAGGPARAWGVRAPATPEWEPFSAEAVEAAAAAAAAKLAASKPAAASGKGGKGGKAAASKRGGKGKAAAVAAAATAAEAPEFGPEVRRHCTDADASSSFVHPAR